MEVFLSKIRQLLPVLGSELLTPVFSVPTDEIEEEKLVCTIKGLTAYGRQTSNGFLVFGGSQAVLEERASALTQHPFVVKLRSEMVSDGTLVRKDDHFVFSKEVEFSSPRSAAAVIHGGGANGLVSWKDTQGRTLKQLGG